MTSIARLTGILVGALLLAGTATTKPRFLFAGVLVDRVNQTLHKISSVDGGAFADGALVSGFEFAVPSPDGRLALVKRNGSLYILRRLDGEAPVWRLWEGAPDHIELAAWSDDGSAVALLDRDKSKLELWDNIGTDPERKAAVDLSLLGADVVSVSLDDEAAMAVASVNSKTGSGLYLIKNNDLPRLLFPLGRAGQVRLSQGAIYSADSDRNEILRIRNWDFSMEVVTVASSGHGLADPSGFALSADHKSLLVASREKGQVLVIDLKTNLLQASLDLGFRPTRMDPLGGGSLFLLQDAVRGGRPAVLVDAARLELVELPLGLSAGAAD